MEALEEVFGEETCVARPRKLQSWSCKVAHATCGDQVALDVECHCTCKIQCRNVYLESYANQKECEDALLQLRTERTEAKQRDESVWLFHQLFSSRCRVRGAIQVLFRLDGVTVCEQYFTTALGLHYPNRRIQKYIRLIEVSARHYDALITPNLYQYLYCRGVQRSCQITAIIATRPCAIPRQGRGFVTISIRKRITHQLVKQLCIFLPAHIKRHMQSTQKM